MRPVRWSANSEIYSQPLASVKLQRCIQQPALLKKNKYIRHRLCSVAPIGCAELH